MHPLTRPLPLLLLLLLLWLLTVFLACFQGAYVLSPERVGHALLALLGTVPPSDAIAEHIVQAIRLPRALLAAFSGGILALSGLILQAVLKNDLADPFTLGLSQGAACGASLAIVGVIPSLLPGLPFLTMGGTAACAFLGATFAIAGTLWLGRRNGSFEHSQVILGGVAMATILGSLVALVKALNEESVASIVFWIMGSFQGKSWEHLPLLLIPALPSLLTVLLLWRSLDLFFLDDLQASPMGLNVPRTRLLLLLATSLMTAGCVAVAGVIGFVGLVVPHILRLLLGPLHAPLFPASFLGGGILLVLSDVLSRSLLDGGEEIPVGVVTALLGGPFFALLVKRRP
ncbi:MAG: iron ABC transporter permease [Desulfovibrio sp.]|nr:iron ABC transporter permease [Desulfovibrio sp.]